MYTIQQRGVSQLGVLVGEYKLSRRHFVQASFSVLLFAGFGLFAGIGCVFISVDALRRAPLDWVSLAQGGLGSLVMGIMGIAALGTAGYQSALLARWIRGLSVSLYEQGLVYVEGWTCKVVRYDAITQVWQAVTRHYTNGVYTGTTHVYTLQTWEGWTVKLTDAIGNVEQVGQRVEQEVFRRLMPRALATYTAGGDLPFGPITLNKSGLASKKGRVAWPDVQGITVKKGLVSVKKRGSSSSWMVVPVAKLPNFFIFFSLVDQIRGITR